MYSLFLIIISIIALLWSANHLVIGAAGIAHYYRLPPLLIGFTLVALGTSAPEIMISISAALEGQNDLAIGNAVGSNIANIGLVLGIIALLRPIKMQSSFLKREFPLLLLVMLFTYSLMLDGYLGVVDSCLSLVVCLLLIGYLLIRSRHPSRQIHITDTFWQATLRQKTFTTHLISLITGLIILPLSANLLVNNSAVFAESMGMSELVVGLTIVAIGSSLPDLVTALLATYRGADDIAIGTVLGANLFNLLTVIIFPGIIHPSAISHAVLWRDMPVMFITTLILLWINTRRRKVMTRWYGGLLVVVYCCYIVSLIIGATR